MGCRCNKNKQAAKAGRGIVSQCTGPDCTKKLAAEVAKSPEQPQGVSISANNKKGIVQ